VPEVSQIFPRCVNFDSISNKSVSLFQTNFFILKYVYKRNHVKCFKEMLENVSALNNQHELSYLTACYVIKCYHTVALVAFTVPYFSM